MTATTTELDLDEFVIVTGGELTQFCKEIINSNMKYLISHGIRLENVLIVFWDSPEAFRYIEDHWDSY